VTALKAGEVGLIEAHLLGELRLGQASGSTGFADRSAEVAAGAHGEGLGHDASFVDIDILRRFYLFVNNNIFFPSGHSDDFYIDVGSGQASPLSIR